MGHFWYYSTVFVFSQYHFVRRLEKGASSTARKSTAKYADRCFFLFPPPPFVQVFRHFLQDIFVPSVTFFPRRTASVLKSRWFWTLPISRYAIYSAGKHLCSARRRKFIFEGFLSKIWFTFPCRYAIYEAYRWQIINGLCPREVTYIWSIWKTKVLIW